MNVCASEHPAVYNVEIDKVDENRWNELILLFDDASIYQTWSSGAIRVGAENLSHLILRKNSEIIGLCQVVIKRVRLVKTGIADINRGPLWKRCGREVNVDHLLRLLKALKNEYTVKRGLLLRLWPNEIESYSSNIKLLLDELGFKYNQGTRRFRTLRLDLNQSFDELRKNLLQKWRNQLNRADKIGMRVIEGSSDDMFRIFLDLIKEMVNRKEFVPQVDYDQFRMIQKDLPEALKMKIMVCEFDDEPIAVSICSAIGDTGIYLLGATGNKGMRLNGSNVLQWRMIEWLKERGCHWYDLGGIDPENNPGVYHFKCGIAGKTGKDETFIGEFDLYSNMRAYLLKIIIAKTKVLRAKMKELSTSAKYFQR